MLSSQVKFSADRQTPVKQYAPDLSMLGHKKSFHSAALHLSDNYFVPAFYSNMINHAIHTTKKEC